MFKEAGPYKGKILTKIYFKSILPAGIAAKEKERQSGQVTGRLQTQCNFKEFCQNDHKPDDSW